ncbi:cutinase family protein [Kribbella speibonae]|uniref:Cutinase family protein n=1 Tax=Kribbella speibonae TaxID=1572660 RepID=A0A4R0J3H8_9ACTN|nr:cutinase family protein [Kribbella speibonae]TCC40469.1 cutinase family protein [Kribbella speibonae]
MKKLAALVAGLVAAAGGVYVVAAPAATADDCGGTYTIVVGGTGDNDSNAPYWSGNISQRVGYPAQPIGINARQGVNELNRLIRDHRNACPGQHVKAVGFSLGAAVVHTWVTENWQTFDNVNAVLIADPKRAAGPENAGVAGHPAVAPVIGAPLAGADNFFGNVPVLTLCTDDIICNLDARSGVPGYIWGAHGNYNFNVDAYSDDARGQWFNGVFIP